MTATATTQIAEGDTVKLDGGRANWTVQGLYPRGFDVTRTTGHPRRGGERTTVLTGIRLDRLTLVRKGNRVDDVADAMIAEIDALKALRAGTITQAEYDVARAAMLRAIGA